MRSYKLLFTIYVFSFLVADPFKPLNTDFLNQEIISPKISSTIKQKKQSKKALPLYDEVVKDYIKIVDIDNLVHLCIMLINSVKIHAFIYYVKLNNF